jgi:hypothetical protein
LPVKKPARIFDEKFPLGLAAPDHAVSYGTVLSIDTFPGTSCQATIGMSLWDTNKPLDSSLPTEN